ncbi:putative surface protease GP63, partial [Trypanosoma theileri]
MAPREEEGVGIYYTALTMAFFEDLGYYKANWGMEEPMSWGHKKGCSFINEACIKNGISRYPETFCNTSTTRCTSNRYALGECESLEDLDADNEIDFCPIIVGSTVIQEGGDSQPTSFCTFGDESLLTGSLIGPDSWCLDGEGLQVQNTRKSVESLSGVCAQVSCDEGRRTVEVQYKGSNTFKECPEGTSIDVESSAFQSGGKIKCPKYDEVCTITPDGRSRLSMN